MTRRWAEFNRSVIEEFRRTAGVVERFGGMDVVIVHTRRPDGTVRPVPLIPVFEGGDSLLFATNAGSTTDPAWAVDLTERPEVDVEHAAGGEVVTTGVTAVRLAADAAAPIVSARAATTPQLADYLERAAGRPIPVFRLDPPIPPRRS